jgi:hypothetical protein
MHPLSESWDLWAHHPLEMKWTLSSYTRIMTVSTAEEALAVLTMLPDKVLESCMFFIMREGVPPLWEDPHNNKGGSFSYKVSQSIANTTRSVMLATVGKTLSPDKAFMKDVNGISISPKKNFCILKVWMRTCKHIDASKIPHLPAMGCLFKKH